MDFESENKNGSEDEAFECVSEDENEASAIDNDTESHISDNANEPENENEVYMVMGDADSTEYKFMPYKKPKRKISLLLAIYLIIISMITAACFSVLGTVFVIDRMGGNTLGLSSEGWEKLKWGFATIDELYYQDVDEQKIVDGALMGLSYALDEYSTYMPVEVVDEFMEEVNAEDYCGVGMYIYADIERECVVVSSTLPNSPAEKGGIKTDDIIKAVDGKAIKADVDKASSLLMGERGTEVVITVIKADSGNTEEVKVTREEIQRDIISAKMLKDNIGYIEMDSFGSETYNHFVNEFEKLKNKGMKKLIIDLRDNPGGYLSSATAIAEIFLDDNDLIISTKDNKGNVTEYRASSDGADMDVAVLCNDGSASASEILAVALKDNGKAVVVGTKTYGKGVTQAMIPYDDGSMFKVTDTRYYTPKGVCIDKIGVEPDVKVEDDKESEKDEQLEAAIEVMSEK